MEGFLDGDQEAVRPEERQDDALGVFQPGSPGLAAHRGVKEEDIERVLHRTRAWRRRRLDAIRKDLLDRPTEKAPLQVLIEEIVCGADDKPGAAGQPPVEARQRLDERTIMQADGQRNMVARCPHDRRQRNAGEVVQMDDLGAFPIDDLVDGIRGPRHLMWAGANRDHRQSVGFRKRRRQLRDVDGGRVRVC